MRGGASFQPMPASTLLPKYACSGSGISARVTWRHCTSGSRGAGRGPVRARASAAAMLFTQTTYAACGPNSRKAQASESRNISKLRSCRSPIVQRITSRSSLSNPSSQLLLSRDAVLRMTRPLARPLQRRHLRAYDRAESRDRMSAPAQGATAACKLPRPAACR